MVNDTSLIRDGMMFDGDAMNENEGMKVRCYCFYPTLVPTIYTTAKNANCNCRNI